LLLGLLGAALGWTVTYVSCGKTGSCQVWAGVVAILSFAAVTVGTGLLLVLVYRSIGEWREAEAQGREPPGPGCETPQP